MGVHAHVGRNFGQDHVAADKYLGFFAVQRDVLWRVAKPADAAPSVLTNFDKLAVHQAAVSLGHSGHHLAVIKNPLVHLGLVFRIVPAVGGKELLCAHTAKVRGAMGRHGGRLVFCGADQQGRFEFVAQPMRQAHVVGVHVRDQHAQNGQPFHGARKHLFPRGLRAGVGHTAIDGSPAFAHACCSFF